MPIPMTSDFPTHTGPTAGYFVCQTANCQHTYEQERFASLADAERDPSVKCEVCGGYVVKQGNVSRTRIAKRRPVIDPTTYREQLARDKQDLAQRRRQLEADERAHLAEEEDFANRETALDADARRTLLAIERDSLETEATVLEARLAVIRDRLAVLQTGGAS